MKSLIELIPHPELPVSTTDKVKDKIIARMKDLGLNKGQFKLDVKVLLWICVCVESSIEKNVKIDKKQLVLELLCEVFGLSQSDTETISNNIDILHATKRIKKRSYWKLFIGNFREVFTL